MYSVFVLKVSLLEPYFGTMFVSFRFPLPKLELRGHWTVKGQGDRKKTALMPLPVETRKLGIKVCHLNNLLNLRQYILFSSLSLASSKDWSFFIPDKEGMHVFIVLCMESCFRQQIDTIITSNNYYNYFISVHTPKTVLFNFEFCCFYFKLVYFYSVKLICPVFQ